MSKEAIEITNRLQAQFQSLVEVIKTFPDEVLVARCPNGSWAKVTYDNFGLGLACFISQKDAEAWHSRTKKERLRLVKMTKTSAIELAKFENIKYLHLLSDNAATPLGHEKV